MRVGISAGGSGLRYGPAVLVLAGLLLGACGGGAVSSAPPTVDAQGLRPAEVEPLVAGTGCPEGISRIVDAQSPVAAETILALDFSGSFVSTDQARTMMRTQVRAMVEQSVERGSALRILSFTRTASGANTIVACPSLAAKYNNAAARSRKIENLKRQATVAVDAALQSAIRIRLTQKAGPGTSIVGGFLALSESAPLVRPGTPRDAVMFSDGQGLDEDAVIDFSGFRTVSLYGVGANTGAAMGTEQAAATAQNWIRWLAEHGARSPNASTQAMF